MRFPLASLLGLALLYLAFVLFDEARTAFAAEVVDQSRVLLLFGSVVLVGLAAGVLLALTFVPLIGEWIGNLFHNPGGSASEETRHARAVAAAARGDYARAVEDYDKLLAEDPLDWVAVTEAARLEADNLQDSSAAITRLDEALTHADWSPDERASLALQLAGICWTSRADVRRACELLQTLVEAFPNTRQAAQAQLRLAEIQHTLATER